MLPESKGYLEKEGWADQPAGLVMMACFIGGFFGIQAVSRFLHQYMPSHVVDCDHSHDQPAPTADSSCETSRQPSRTSRARRRRSRTRSPHFHAKDGSMPAPENGSVRPSESTPLLQDAPPRSLERNASVRRDEVSDHYANGRERAITTDATLGRRPSMYDVQKRVMSFVRDTKSNCDEEGRCYGYTDPCGQECFKHLSARSVNASRHSTLLRTTTGPFHPSAGSVFNAGHDHDVPEPMSPMFRSSRAASRDPLDTTEDAHLGGRPSSATTDETDLEAQHHHHVPANAFLSIGLQTSIAIALHKFPEGFITYATNHANPTLGFNVFMALFVHNITEGFALALPLYMALGSRWRAMLWSSLLGGLSQPIGAAVAALWFKLAQRTHMAPSAVAYACLFAVTSGIMVSVALQLFVEGLNLNHNRNLCIFFGFIGMALLGLSNALFAGH